MSRTTASSRRPSTSRSATTRSSWDRSNASRCTVRWLVAHPVLDHHSDPPAASTQRSSQLAIGVEVADRDATPPTRHRPEDWRCGVSARKRLTIQPPRARPTAGARSTRPVPIEVAGHHVVVGGVELARRTRRRTSKPCDVCTCHRSPSGRSRNSSLTRPSALKSPATRLVAWSTEASGAEGQGRAAGSCAPPAPDCRCEEDDIVDMIRRSPNPR